ncbi:MAG: ATP-binding protein [Bacteroidales bacterium]|nr:ATP-binding protein [Bacteroidales bacterium]
MLTKYRIEYTECDFKREVERTKTKNWLKTVCAYANGIGGMLIFGIDDKTRSHVPLKDIQSDIEFVTNCIKDRISPVPDFVLAPDTDEDGNEILVLTIKGGLNTPYYLLENSNKTTLLGRAVPRFWQIHQSCTNSF